LKTVAKYLAKCKLNAVGNTADWDKDSPEPTDDYTFSMEMTPLRLCC
jgi:hypothetical protein